MMQVCENEQMWHSEERRKITLRLNVTQKASIGGCLAGKPRSTTIRMKQIIRIIHEMRQASSVEMR